MLGSHDLAVLRCAFADCIRSGRPPRTQLADGLADLDLARDIIEATPPKSGEANA
jgi:hypothetical protein